MGKREETEETENYLESVSDKELAETLDYAFSQELSKFDSAFPSYYEEQIDRLRAFDALKAQTAILGKYRNAEKKYQRELENLDTLYDIYKTWKKDTSRITPSYIDDFYYSNQSKISALFPELDRVSLNKVSKMIRTAREKEHLKKEEKENTEKKMGSKTKYRPIKDRYKITEPKKPEEINSFQKNQIDRSLSPKSDAELMQLLGRGTLEGLADMTAEAMVTQRTDKLKLTIQFLFSHYCNANTKGKEYSRTDKQVTKNGSKTSGKTLVNLLKQYNSMLSDDN